MFVLCTILEACNKKDSALVLGFGDIRHINEFREKFDLQVDTTFVIDNNVTDIAIIDTLLLLNSGAWDIRSLPQMTSLGHLFARGHARGEFEQIPAIYKSAFYMEDGTLFTIIYDVQRGKCFKVNISQSIFDDSLYIEDFNHKVTRHLDRYLYIDDSTYITRENIFGSKPKKLSCFENNKELKNRYFDKMNSINIASDDYNLLAAFCGYNKKHNKFILVYNQFNVINIIPLNSEASPAITLCYGDNSISLDDVVNEIDPKTFYYELRIYDSYFAVLCLKDKKHPTIQFYGYDGSAQIEYKLAKSANSFDIDWKNHHLYTYNDEEGTIIRYKIAK